MFDKLSYTWSLMGASWDVLKRDKSLLLFPLFSGICCMIVIASFIAPMIGGGATWLDPEKAQTTAEQVAGALYLFAFYFANYLVITFFNTAIVACAISRMQGGNPSFGGGIREAMSRIHLIIGWAIVAATVGMLLRAIESRSRQLGSIISGLLGAAWTITTYLVVPVLVVEQQGPFAALKTSAKLLKRTWGEQLAGNFSFGLVFFLLFLPVIPLVFVAIKLGSVLGMVLIGVGVIYMVVLALVQSALQSIFQAAVYLYALDPALLSTPLSDGRRGFPVQLISQSMGTK